MSWRAALAWSTALGASAALACGEPLGQAAHTIDDAAYRLVYSTAPAPVSVGRHFAIELTLCPKAGQKLPSELRVDAHMPDHKHGMNYQPSVKAEGHGRYRAEGLMFHMPGRWELVFELVAADGSVRRLTQDQRVD